MNSQQKKNGYTVSWHYLINSNVAPDTYRDFPFIFFSFFNVEFKLKGKSAKFQGKGILLSSSSIYKNT